MSAANIQKFQLIDELNKTVTKSLVNTFGLDFLLFEDKKGGEVATVHNVRQHQKGDSEIYVSNSLQQGYADRGDYKPLKYHSDSKYDNKGEEDKAQHKDGSLVDKYRGQKMSVDEKRQLDHIISSHEVHDDAGRALAGIDGVELANQDTNFQSTHYYINNLKSDHSMDEFLRTVVPKTMERKRENIDKNIQTLESMPTETKQQRHKKRQLESKIDKEKKHLEVLESIDEEKMRKADEKARNEYDKQINSSYYSSSKFFKNTAFESSKAGLKMGIRQALGLVLAEVWFELKDAIHQTFKDFDNNFTFEKFLEKLQVMAINIWGRIKIRFKDILEEFKNGVFAGALASLSNTIINIFFTTQKLIGKLLRETWSSLIAAAKILFFNPDKLAAGALAREVTRILSTGVAVAMGVMLNQQLASLMTFPLGVELAAFVSAIVTGLMTIGITYFLDHSKLMQKVWDYLDQFKSDAKKTLEYYQKVNDELDRYLIELSKTEFNLSPEELLKLTSSLESTSCENEREILLSEEIRKRGIELPFESNNVDSTRNWLMSL